MTWASTYRASWDTETTGTDVTEDRIVTAAIVIRGGTQDHVHSWVINPGIECPTEASDIHGWTTERLIAEGTEPKVALDDLATRLCAALTSRVPLISFNTAFDYSILHYELLRHGLATIEERLDGRDPVAMIDAHVLDKGVDKYRPGSRTLKATAEHYGVAPQEWHTAEADALAALLVAEQIAVRNPSLGGLLPEDLFTVQQDWAAKQAASRQAYLRSPRAGDRQDPRAVVDGAWPLKGDPS